MTKNITLYEWHSILEKLGCGNDPIVYQGKKLDVSELASHLGESTKIDGIRIMYYDGFKKKWVSGTPLSMLMERQRPEEKIITTEQVIASIDCALESENRHSESASRIWRELERYIPKSKQLAAAKALSNSLDVDWKIYLNNVS